MSIHVRTYTQPYPAFNTQTVCSNMCLLACAEVDLLRANHICVRTQSTIRSSMLCAHIDTQDLQPSVWAIKRQLMHYATSGLLEFYLDLHAHANKKGVFIYGNALEGEQALSSLLYAKLIALNSPVFDFMHCNYTEKNMSRADKVRGVEYAMSAYATHDHTSCMRMSLCPLWAPSYPTGSTYKIE